MTVVRDPCLSSSCRALHTRSRHAIEIEAPAQAVFTAVEAVTVKEVRFLRELEFYTRAAGLGGDRATRRADGRRAAGSELYARRRLARRAATRRSLSWRDRALLASRRQRACRLQLARGVPGLYRARIRQGRCWVPTRSERSRNPPDDGNALRCDRRSDTQAHEPLLADHPTCEQRH